MDQRWNLKVCFDLIEAYKSHPVLWDMKNIKYYDQKIKMDAWDEISRTLNLPVGILKRKIFGLTGSYRREKSREKKSKVRGENYKSRWFAYVKMNFLDGRRGTMSDEEESNMSLNDIAEVNDNNQDTPTFFDAQHPSNSLPQTTHSPTRDTSPLPSNFNEFLDDDDSKLTMAINLLKKSAGMASDSLTSFGIHIANEIRKFDKKTQAHVKFAISNIIYQAELGKYDYTSFGNNLFHNHESVFPTTSKIKESSPSYSFEIEMENTDDFDDKEIDENKHIIDVNANP